MNDSGWFSVLLSGQLILVLWQIIKEVRESRAKKAKEDSQDRTEFLSLKNMVFKLYRDNLERKVLQTYEEIAKPDSEINMKEHLMNLQDDMEVYLQAGGNSTVKDLYIRLTKYVRERLGESYYILLVIDGLDIK